MITLIDDELVAKILALKPGCRRLNLANNAITTIVSPGVLVPLAQLTFLDLSNNFLTELGPPFSALVSLRVLNAANNRM
jgi:Leucine-rich repeat (LRR) protein